MEVEEENKTKLNHNGQYDNGNSNNELKFYSDNLKKQKSLEHLVHGIFPIEFIRKHFICRICSGVLYNPKQCSECEEDFCEDCFTEYLREKKLCINSCSITNPVKTHPSVINLLEKLTFRCMFNSKEIISYTEIERHIRTSCKHRPFICKFEGCNFLGTSDEINMHQNNCGFQKVSCPICKSIFYSKNAFQHKCAEFFIEKYTKTKERFNKMVEQYEAKLKDVEILTDYVEKQINSKIK